MLCMSVLCIRVTLQYGVILLLNLFFVLFPLSRTLVKVLTGNTETVPELKASITYHVSSIYRETLRPTVDYTITRFEHGIDVNEMHIE